MTSNLKPPFKKKIIVSKTFLFFLLLLLIWLVLITVKVAYKKYQMNEEVASLQMEIAKLRQEKNDLMSSIQSVNDQSFLETEARRRLNLQKEGEQVVFLKKTEGAESKKLVEQNATSTQTEIDKQESNLSKWWRYFFK